jgi:DHA1 family solute carrier family 18 vesicular amine transporter 1/2
VQRSAVLAVASIALAVDMFVYGVAIPVLPMIAAEHGASSATVGMLFACYAGALLLATPLVGVLVDRFGPRTPMLVGLLALGAATLLFAWADSFATLVAARVLQGGAAAV